MTRMRYPELADLASVEAVDAYIAENIAANLRDDEVCHSNEDALHCLVLSAIAQGHIDVHDAPAIAEAAMRTTQLDFARWYA